MQALLLALLCSVLFLRDGLLPGRALVPHPPELFDVHMAAAKAAGTFDPADAFRGNAGMTDKYLQSLCWDRVMQDRFLAGELPRWTRDIGGGAPFVPQMAQPWQPINLLLFLLPSEQWYGWWYLLHQVAFGCLAYAFFRRLGCLHGSALLGLVAAVLGMWTQCRVHHNVVLTAALPLWPMLTAVHGLVVGGHGARDRRWHIGWLGLWTGMSWCSGFVVVSLQVTYLTGAFALLLAAQAARGERLRRLVPVGIGLALGALLSLANMLPVLAASAVSARAGTFDPARLQALGLEWDHALSSCWPDLLSWAADRFYVPTNGDQLTHDLRVPWSQLVLLEHPFRPEDKSAFQNWVETSFAIGLVPLAAAALAFVDRQRRALVWFFAAAALLSFGIATADQPFFGLARLMPGICAGDLRRLLFTTAMSLVVLATLGADHQLRSGRRAPMVVVLGVVLVASAAAFLWTTTNGDDPAFVRAIAQLCAADADHPDVVRAGGTPETVANAITAVMHAGEAAHNRDMLQATALRALLTAALGLLSLWLRAGPRAFVWLVLTAAELLHAGLGPVVTVPAERVTTVPAVLRPLAEAATTNGVRPRLQRLTVTDTRKVTALPGNLPGFLGIEDAGAYNPLPPARYEEFFKAIEPDRDGKPSVAYGGAGTGAFHDPASLQHPLCDLYGIRFVLSREPIETTPALVERAGGPAHGGFRLLERTTTLGRATFVDQVDLLPDAQERLAALRRPDRDVRSRVVLEDPAAPPPIRGAAADARVELLSHADERVVVRVTTTGDGYLRLADPYDAGWRAHVDGKPTTVYVADHYLRAVHVPPGDHEVVFTYDGPMVVWPLRLSVGALLALVVLVVLGRRRRA